MRFAEHPLATAAILATSLLLLGLLLVPSAASLDLFSLFPLHGPLQELKEARQRTSTLNAHSRAVVWRLLTKIRVIDATLDGHLSLLEAAAWFHYLDEELGWLPYLATIDRDGSPVEQCCRAVVRHARVAATRSSRPHFAVEVERLEMELDWLLSSPSNMILPRPPELPGLPPCPQID